MPWQVKCKSCNYLITEERKDRLEYYMAKHQQRHKQARFSAPWIITWTDYRYYHLKLKNDPSFWYEFNHANKSAQWIAEALQQIFKQ
jgi:ABC-type Zn uptake system ZnuABC Zn-binding protein ZnuA